MIELDGVSYGYREGETVLADVTVRLDVGLTLLVGPNGCGKSTLMKLAAGIERPDAGRVLVDGRDLWIDEVEARRSLAFVPEQPDLTPYATVEEILTLVSRLRGEPRLRVAQVLELVGLGRLGDRSVRELSMGQRRRATLAAALLGAPRHILLDEPLEAMDRGARELILTWIDRLVEHGATVVVVSHELEPFAPRARTALTLREGKPVTASLPEDGGERLEILERLAR